MSLIDEIKIKSLSEAQEILKAVGSEDIFEKAHKDGDLHPNGKWVWVSSAAGGKGDWRTLNGRTHKKHQASGIVGSGTVSSSAVNSTGSGNSVGGNKSVNTTTGASSKKTSSTNSLKSPSKVFKKILAKNSDELYKKTLSYLGGRISAKTKNGLIEGTIQNSTKKDDRVILTIKKDDGSFTKISTSIRGTSKYQAPQPDASKIKEIKDGKKEVKISSATGKTDWSTVNYLINSGMEIQYRHGLSFRSGSNSSKKISAEEALEKINKNTAFDASVEGGILHINTYSGFDMD